MIVGTIDHCEKYYAMGAGIQKAFEWLKDHDIKSLDAGQYNVDGERLYVQVQKYRTKGIDDCWFEGHLNYIDLHYMVNGNEYFGYTPIGRAGETITEYDTMEDDFLYRRDYESRILLKEGDFAIVWPEDIHLPQYKVVHASDVVKVCVKIVLDY